MCCIWWVLEGGGKGGVLMASRTVLELFLLVPCYLDTVTGVVNFSLGVTLISQHARSIHKPLTSVLMSKDMPDQ